MVDYRLDQSGQEVQDILNGAAMQVDLTAENERAMEAEQTLQGNINDEETRAKGVEGTLQDNIDAEEARAKAAEKQNADDIDALEAVVPTGASSENKLATESFVNDSVATATATFRGTYNLVSDLHLTLEATHTNIANALATAVTTANNNDFVFVQIPTSEETPTVIGSIERYKYNGFSWSYEYTLNNSGFTQAQWDAVNSGITGGDVAKLRALPTNTELTTLLNGLQGDIDAEEGRAKAAELNLQGAIDAEEVRAKAAEKANADDIDALEAVIPSTASSENKVATASDVSSLSAAIEAILLLIPSAASSVNQLADKAFVNSSIATNTSIFRGTYNLVSDLHLTLAATHAQIGNALALAILEANNNDYAFVQIPTVATAPTEIAQTDRYKWNGSTWEYEYTLNNSGFTSAQWTAINSGITSALVSKLSALPTNSELTSEIGTLVSAINAINLKIPSSASLANKLVDTAALESSIIQVLGVLTVSYNITSTDGHFSFHIEQVDGKITAVEFTTSDVASQTALDALTLRVDTAEGTITTLGNRMTAAEENITSLGGRMTTAEGNITNLTGRVSTNEEDIAQLQAAYEALTQSEIIIGALPASGVANKIYRVPDTNSYSDYMWNGTQFVLMATYNNAIDDEPTPSSNNLVKSGGVLNSIIQNGPAFDLSAYNAVGGVLATYADLSAALTALNALDSVYKQPGMSFKFVQTDDNKYVEYFLTKDEWSANEDDWEKMNLEEEIIQLGQEIYGILGDDGKRDLVVTGQILATGNVGATASTTPTSIEGFGYIKESCSPGDIYLIYVIGGLNGRAYAFCDSNNKVLESVASQAKYCGLVFAPANTSYIVVNNNFSAKTPNLANPVMYKITAGALNSLYSKILSGDAALSLELNGLKNSLPFKYLQYTSFVTGYFIGVNGQNAETSSENRQINTYSVTPGRYTINRLQGNQYTRGWRLKDGNGNILALGPIGGESIVVNESVDVTVDGTLDVFFMNTYPCVVTNITDFGPTYVEPYIESVEKEIAKIDKKATNVGGYYLKNNKILLSGASISSISNGYFEYAMQELGITGLNISEPAVNIYYLAYKLYSNSEAYADYDILIISHVHNFDVFTLPAGKENYSVSDYENDSVLGDYIKTTSHYSGNLADASGYTANELYAMGFDYCIKKWAALCYAFKDVAGYNSVFGKPCQIILYTYWHDARTIYNEAVRKLAKKWCFLLIKDDENVGFSKDRTHPVTGQQWSRLYADTTGFQPTETIDGVVYGFHPDRMTTADYNAWQNSGVLLQSYLPFIQKVRSAILMNTLKDSLIKDINP